MTLHEKGFVSLKNLETSQELEAPAAHWASAPVNSLPLTELQVPQIRSSAHASLSAWLLRRQSLIRIWRKLQTEHVRALRAACFSIKGIKSKEKEVRVWPRVLSLNSTSPVVWVVQLMHAPIVCPQ